MTYLELCQEVAREGGTAGTGTVPTTVASQTGELSKIVNWTRKAWTEIQNSRREWRFLEAEFSGSTVADQRFYTAAEMGITTRFGSWVTGDDENQSPVFIYDPATGIAGQRVLTWCPWRLFRSTRMIGNQTSSLPVAYTINADDEIGFDDIPDKVFTVEGFYRKSAQTLSADTDVPDCPERFHNTIVAKALMYLSAHEEAQVQYSYWSGEYQTLYGHLMADQLPKFIPPRALA